MPAIDRRTFLGKTSGAVLLTAAGLRGDLHAAEEKALALLLFGGDLPGVRKDLEKDYRVRVLTGGQVKGAEGVRGLEQLVEADVWIGSVDKRTKPSEEQLAHFKKFHEAGKPIVGYRAASHVFQNWLAADKEVFGIKYGGHHLLNKEKDLRIEVAEGAKDHPLLKGIALPPPNSGSYVYTEAAPDVKVLLRCGLPGDMMPHTWVRENANTKGRVFYTRYDAKDLATDEVCRQLFLRGLFWALNRDLAPYRKKG